jgi:hypothetical protein
VNRLSDILGEVGYHCCATTRVGRAKPADDLMQLKRLPVNSCDDPKLFQAKLDGAYDWVAPLQAGAKRIKSVISPRHHSPAYSSEPSAAASPTPNSPHV